MAITVVNSAQTGPTATATLTITSATAGNLLVTFINQSSSLLTPTLTGYTVNATSSAYNTTYSVWVAYKIAAGGETSIAPTAGAGGAINGICYWELNGAANPLALDGSPATASGSAATGAITVSTSTSGSVVLIGVGTTATTTAQSAWTGTDVAINISTSATRCFGGSFVTTGTLSSQVFTANWTTSRPFGMLSAAFQPPAGGTNHGMMMAL